jgi:EPS-associated MarR family transcriptional regulator
LNDKRNKNLPNEELTLQILRSIENTQSQKSLAQKLEVSVGKVNYVLKALVEKGFVKAENFYHNKQKNQYKYLLTKEGFQEKLSLTEKFIQRKKKEYDELQEELKRYKSEKIDDK